jgi:STAND-like protein
MSSTRRPTSLSNNSQLIIDALAKYADETGIDLTKNPSALEIERSSSPEDILQLLHKREKAFKEYREGNRKLINCLKPVVKVLHALSGMAVKASSLPVVSVTYPPVNLLTLPLQVHFPPAKPVFTGIDELLAVRPSNALFN